MGEREGLEQELTRSLLVEVALVNWKEALHADVIWADIQYGPPRVLTFTRYETITEPPKPCACKGCTYFHKHKARARKKLGKMSMGKLIRLLQIQWVVEEE